MGAPQGLVNVLKSRSMTGLADPLPKDAETLAAMLIAEREVHAAEMERLRQIIKELQRHRFGRRAETLPLDQLEAVEAGLREILELD